MGKLIKTLGAKLLLPIYFIAPAAQASTTETAFHEFVGAQQTVEQKKEEAETKEQTKQKEKPQVKIGGLGLTTTQLADGFGTLSSSMTFFTFPTYELWLVGGQNYNESGINEYDIGLKYIKGKRMLRGTVLSEKDNDKKERFSAGLDWDALLKSYKNFDLSVLGDVSAVDRRRRHTDYGVGTKVTLKKDHNAFFLYSNRGEQEKSDYRLGYMFWDKDVLAAFLVDDAEGKKPAISGFFGTADKRFVATYDTENGMLSSNNILAFGSTLPAYATRAFLANHFILTKRSVSDSDALHFFQPTFFIAPLGRVGGIFRFNALYDTKSRQLKGFLLYNVLMAKTNREDGFLFTQNINRDGGSNYYGAGIGYKFGKLRMAPVIRYQQGKDGKKIVLDFSLNY